MVQLTSYQKSIFMGKVVDYLQSPEGRDYFSNEYYNGPSIVIPETTEGWKYIFEKRAMFRKIDGERKRVSFELSILIEECELEDGGGGRSNLSFCFKLNSKTNRIKFIGLAFDERLTIQALYKPLPQKDEEGMYIIIDEGSKTKGAKKGC